MSCEGCTPTEPATILSADSRDEYKESVAASILLTLARTRGEHPVVFSFKSSRSSAGGVSSGEEYSRISRIHWRPLSTCTPRSDGFRMGLQSFGLGQCNHRRRNPAEPCSGKLLDGNGLHK